MHLNMHELGRWRMLLLYHIIIPDIQFNPGLKDILKKNPLYVMTQELERLRPLLLLNPQVSEVSMRVSPLFGSFFIESVCLWHPVKA
jgi:hypothetical protein